MSSFPGMDAKFKPTVSTSAMCRNTGGRCTAGRTLAVPSRRKSSRCHSDASPTRAPSREVSWFHAARCRWRHKRPKRSPRLRSLGAWLQRFFAGRLGVSVQKVGVTRASSFPSPSGITVVESNRIGPMESPRALQIQASSTEETPTPSSVVQICQKWTPCNSAIAH